MTQDWTIHGKLTPPDDVILDCMGLPLVVVDQRCRIVRVNTATEHLTGFYRSKLVGRSCADLLMQNPCGSNCPVQKILRSEVTRRFDVVTIQSADMRKLSVALVTSPLLGPRGKVIGAVEIMRELTDEQSSETEAQVPWPTRKLQQELDAIEEALESNGGNITQAARALRMHRTTLWRKIKRLGLKI